MGIRGFGSRNVPGTMTFGEDWGWGAPPVECRRMFDAYADAGGNVIDTAVNYTDGASEESWASSSVPCATTSCCQRSTP